MDKVPALSSILRKYGIDKKFGVARLHKHYDLQTG